MEGVFVLFSQVLQVGIDNRIMPTKHKKKPGVYKVTGKKFTLNNWDVHLISFYVLPSNAHLTNKP